MLSTSLDENSDLFEFGENPFIELDEVKMFRDEEEDGVPLS